MEMQMSAATMVCVHFSSNGFGEFCRVSPTAAGAHLQAFLTCLQKGTGFKAGILRASVTHGEFFQDMWWLAAVGNSSIVQIERL